MFYKELVKYFIRLESTSSHLEKADILAELLKRLKDAPQELLKTVLYLAKGDVFPPWMNREINVGDKTIISAVSRSTGASKIEILDLLRNKGDLGSVTATLMAKRRQKSGQWSKDEVKLLKQMFRSTSTAEVAKKLGRKVPSVQAKATKLGLKKTKKYLKSIGRAK